MSASTIASTIYSEDKDVIADAQRIYEKEKAEKCIENEECEYEKNEYPFTEYEDGSKSVRIACVLVIVLCGLLSIILPLYLNTKRHIAKDLREE